MGNRIIEVFVRIHEMLASNKEVLEKLDELEKKGIEHDEKLLLIFEYIKQFKESKQHELEFKNRKQIGFKMSDK